MLHLHLECADGADTPELNTLSISILPCLSLPIHNRQTSKTDVIHSLDPSGNSIKYKASRVFSTDSVTAVLAINSARLKARSWILSLSIIAISLTPLLALVFIIFLIWLVVYTSIESNRSGLP